MELESLKRKFIGKCYYNSSLGKLASTACMIVPGSLGDENVYI